MSESLQRIKELGDALAASGTPVDDVGLVYHMLHDLPDDFEPFTNSIEVRSDPVLLDDLHRLLLSKEISLLEMHKRP